MNMRKGLAGWGLTGGKPVFAAAVAAVFLVQPAQAAVTIHTSNFLTSWTNYNGFEGMGRTITYDGHVGYTEQDITALYVGTPGVIMSNMGFAEGRYSWYPNAGSDGYTSLTFGGIIEGVSFLASTGFGGASSPNLYYELLLDGVTISTGLAGGLNIFGDSWKWYGFSGVQFDELRLQARSDQGTDFRPTAYDALAIDGVRFNGYWEAPEPPVPPAIPEGPIWALMIAGFGLTGVGLRRRRRRPA